MIDFVLGFIEQLLSLWDLATAPFDPDLLPVIAYSFCALLALLLWSLITRKLPRVVGVPLFMLAVAFLLTPTVTGGIYPQLAPANVSVLYGLGVGNSALWISSLAAIGFCFFVLMALYFLWLEVADVFGLSRTTDPADQRNDQSPHAPHGESL